MMLNSTSRVAVVIGEGTMPIRCAEQLVARGWTIEAIVSIDPTVASWAKGQGFQSFSPRNAAQVADCLRDLSFDCLFSVVNSLLLNEEVIGLARHRAVNYHDALLPRYAGLNAATWALIKGETQHGVTWHELTTGIDEGDVLVQVPVTVAEDETSLTLNVKCYEAAIAGFETLVEQLEQGQEVPRPQDLSQRTYFAGWAKPWAGGLLDFSQDATSLSRLVRGLSFGPSYLNGVTLPKLWLGDFAGSLLPNPWVVVQQLTPCPQRSGAEPGTIVKFDAQQIIIATATEDVAISGFQTAGGDRLQREDLGLAVGDKLPYLAEPESLQTQSEDVARHEGFWSRRLKASESLKLTWMESSSGKELPDTQGLATASRAWALPDELSQGMAAMARPHCEENQAVALAVTTALGAYLSRLSDEGYGDLAFSGPEQQMIVQQANAALAQDASLFSSLVPMRMRLTLADPMATALATVAKERSILAKRGSYATDLQLRDPQLDAVPQWPVGITWLGAETATNKLQDGQILNLVFEGTKCRWDYDPDKLSMDAIARLEGQLESFMAGILAHPEQPLSHQPLLMAQERQQMLLDWNQTEADYLWNCCTHHLFEQQVARSPEAIALQYGAAQLSYAELNQRANQVAHGLLARGIQPDDPVGVHMDRSLEMIIALLGVLKAGGCYLPMDPDYPRDRRLLMVEDAEPKVILTQSYRQGQLDHGCELCLDDANTWAGLSTENPEIEIQPHHLAYIIYTSGSTGRPKGVMIEHRSLSNFAQAGCADYGINGGDRVLQFASISFDAAAEEIYPCLISGGTLVLRTAEMMESIPQFIQACETYGLTILDLPTAYWHLLVAELDEGTVQLPTAVRIVIIGGEAVNFQRVAQWQQLLWRTGCRAQLLNTYGPTEATVVATFQRLPLPEAEPSEMPLVTIGRPLGNVSAYVLDKNLQPLPLGAPGELCIGGAGLARGYLRRPEKTAEQFVTSSWDANERLYRTGDLVRYLANGEIDYLGRIDNQVKIRGFRIELGEIEAVLSQHPAVRDVAVMLRQDRPGDKRLVAYLSSNPGEAVTSAILHDHLAQKLPSYMIPAAFVQLDALPITPNNKIAYKSLPQPDRFNLLLDRSDNSDAAFVMPQTQTEVALAKIWEEILGVSPVGRHSSFLELGGDSLSAIRLCSQIERTFGKKLLLSNLFQTPTLNELAEVIETDKMLAPQSCVIPLKSQGTRDPLFFVNCAQDANQLAQYIGDDYPVYGLNLFGASNRLFDQLDKFELSLLAKVFIDDIRQIQPVGPYYLSSYCGDTRMALELAQEFQRQGETVALLALIDAWWTVESLPLSFHWQMFRKFGAGYALERLKERSHFIKQKLFVFRDRLAVKFQQLSSNETSAVPTQDVELYQAYVTASDTYKPKPYDGHTVLMFSEELQADETGELDDVFELFSVHGYEQLSVPGYHHALFYPKTLVPLGEHLRQSMDRGKKLAEQKLPQMTH